MEFTVVIDTGAVMSGGGGGGGGGVDCNGTTLSVVDVVLAAGELFVVDSFVLPETRFDRATYKRNTFKKKFM